MAGVQVERRTVEAGAVSELHGIARFEIREGKLEALIEHLAKVSDLLEAILATASLSGEVLGEPSAELKANLADSGAGLFTSYQTM